MEVSAVAKELASVCTREKRNRLEAHSLPAITVTDVPVERTAVSAVVIELASAATRESSLKSEIASPRVMNVTHVHVLKTDE